MAERQKANQGESLKPGIKFSIGEIDDGDDSLMCDKQWS